jgi:hypothetical protein
VRLGVVVVVITLVLSLPALAVCVLLYVLCYVCSNLSEAPGKLRGGSSSLVGSRQVIIDSSNVSSSRRPIVSSRRVKGSLRSHASGSLVALATYGPAPASA